MKTRHKIPAVFSIYMVDVLCCALGCVILLWQLYHHESEEQTAKNDVITKKNDEISKKSDAISAELDAARHDRDQAQKLALLRKQDYDKLKKVYDDAEKLVAVLRVDAKALERKNAASAAELTEKDRKSVV